MFFYTLGIFFYRTAIALVSPFHAKAALMVKGRKELPAQLKKISSLRGNKKLIWFHVASLGEFEQGKPVLERLKKKYPDAQFLLTFFSPSGYEVRKNYAEADYVLYIPFDFPGQVRKFLDAVNPDCVIFVKYEFWLNFLNEMSRRKIPVYLISAVFHQGQPFFRWYGNRFVNALHLYKKIFVQDKASFELLKSLKVKSSVVSGDTRFDRVLEIAAAAGEVKELEQFAENNFVVVAGSSYEKEEFFLVNALKKLKAENKTLRLIIAPHVISEARTSQVVKLLEENGFSCSVFTEGVSAESDVVVLNTMGMLASVYRYGKLAFIGGGFNTGIHSVLEAAVYGMPVLFGPDYHRFNEAHQMLEEGCAFVIKSDEDVYERLRFFYNDTNERKRVSDISATLIKKCAGASEMVSTGIEF